MERFLAEHAKSARRERCVLALTTPGGDPDAAYLMARLLRKIYEHVTVCVFGYCKSAGTLLALGAHEIAMGSRGELGPLDVQVSEKDELAQFGSGLDIFASLHFLIETAFDSFERYLLAMVSRSGGQISTKTAAEIATNLAVGIVAPIASQIDPMKLGRHQRAMDVAAAYARRLGAPLDIIAKLTTDYPDHGFVIDGDEAKKLLPEFARDLTGNERQLEGALAASGLPLYIPVPGPSIIACLAPATEHLPPDSTNPQEERDGLPRDPERDPAETTEGDGRVRPSCDEADGSHAASPRRPSGASP